MVVQRASLESDCPIAPEDVRAELELICRSATFGRSKRLQQFLRYVCECTLRGEAAQIKEYAVARDIFDRGPDYLQHEDSVVRRQAHSLRHKLQEYYAEEGRNDEIRIDLPVGHYVPVFQQFQPVNTAVGTRADIALAPPRRGHWIWAAPLAALLLFVFAVGWPILSKRSPAAPRLASQNSLDPAIRELWGPWLNNPSGASICFSNRMMAIVKHYDKPVSLGIVPGRMKASPAEDANFRRAFSLSPEGYIYLTPSAEQTKMGEAMSGVYLASLLTAGKTSVDSTESRFINWQALRSENLIIFGYSENNEWIDPLLAQYPFHVLRTEGDRLRRIANTRPVAGERSEFRMHISRNADDPTRDYALISMLPGVDGVHQLLLINGLDSECTREATAYLTDPASVRTLLSRMRLVAPRHAGAWRFQMVLDTEIRDKVPTRSSIAALRVL
jgi:hypothetical protein